MEPGTAAPPAMPPGPGLPRLVQTLGFMVPRTRFLERSHGRHGDIVSFSTLFDPRFVMVFAPELVRQVFQGHPDRLRAGEANQVLAPLLGESSVLVLDGARHMRQRRLMLPAFHGERMKAYEATIIRAADRAIDAWPIGSPFPLLLPMQSITLEVIMRAFFGVKEGPLADDLGARVRALLEPVSSRVGVLVMALSGGRFGQSRGMRRFEERRRRLDELLFEEIARRRGAADLDEREDVLSSLILARDEQGEAMSDRELRDELVTLLVAGHETTATGLAWTFDLLLHDERVLGRLHRDLAEGDGTYLDATVKEALRLRPVIPGVGRKVRGEPFELGGYRIPPGVEINPSIRVMHRDGAVFPDPEEFRPERFLGPDPPDTYTWIPFGGGTRRCLGASFALMEMRLVVRRVLERTALRADAPRRARVERNGITLAPRGGVSVVQTRAPLSA